MICELPDASLAKVAATLSGNVAGQLYGGSRRDIVQAVINCFNSKLCVNIS